MSNKKNAYERWRGIPGLEFVWHGEWSDPEIKIHACKEQKDCGIKVGSVLTVQDIEDIMWEHFRDDEQTEDFEEYMKNNVGLIWDMISVLCGGEC